MLYKLKYGNGYQEIQLPPENVLTYVQVVEQAGAGDNRDCLQAALDNPQKSPRLSEFVRDRKILILIEDATRDVPALEIVEAISPELSSAKSIEIMMCTGTHSPAAPGNEELMDSLKKILKKHSIHDANFSIHNSRKPPFHSYGKSSFGNNFLVNPTVKRTEAFVVLSDMKNHYFAGYSNLLKNFVPGVCAYETTERNHAMALEEKSTFGHHPWHPEQNRRDNPLANEMLEGYEKIVSGRPVWALASVSKHGKIIWCQCGDPETVTRNGIAKVDALMSRTVEPADVLIVSSGGYPNDESIYTAQRALELNQHAVKPCGKILFLAECRNGIGPPSAMENFYNLLTNDLHEVFKIIEKRYIMYSHKAYKFARMISKLEFLGMISGLPGKTVKQIHLTPVDDPQKQIDGWLQKNPHLTFNLIDDGNKIAIYPGNSGTV